jgi:hypothetical protein
MFLMEEIEKISLKGNNPVSSNMNLSRQEIINLLNSNKSAVNQSVIRRDNGRHGSPEYNMKGPQTKEDQTRFLRSKS